MRFRREPSRPAPAVESPEILALTPESQAAARLLRAEFRALAERNARLIRKFLTVFSTALVVLALVLLGCGIVSVVLLGQSSSERGTLKGDEQRLAQVQGRLIATQTRLANVQRTLEVSQKASTKTRVTTVGQRCDLTRLILGVLVRVHDTPDAAPFQESYRICLKQLATVKHINAKTPKP